MFAACVSGMANPRNPRKFYKPPIKCHIKTTSDYIHYILTTVHVFPVKITEHDLQKRFTAHQVDFTHFEPSQSLGEDKTGDPTRKTPDHPQAELGLSHM